MTNDLLSSLFDCILHDNIIVQKKDVIARRITKNISFLIMLHGQDPDDFISLNALYNYQQSFLRITHILYDSLFTHINTLVTSDVVS